MPSNKGLSGLPPGGYDEFGTFPAQGTPLWDLLSTGVYRSTDTANADINCHTETMPPAIISPNLGAPLTTECEMMEDE